LGDWRYYKYPEYTYGLGGHTKEALTSDQLNYSNIIIHEAVLRHINNSAFYAGLAYNLDYHWDISESGLPNGEASDFKKYGLTKNSVSSGISVNALYDTRKNSINPTEAMYGSIAFCPNFTFLGSNHNYQSLIIDLRKYFKPFRHSDNVLAFWSYNWFTFNGNVPYLDLPSTGWDPYANMGRGYIQSRFRGKNLLYLEAEYRFGITRNGLFGGVVFANAQSVTDWPSNKFQTIYPAVGTGLRIKINKHSNTNLAIDYAMGLDGSRGIFINLGEVF
jgi:outer membrane protein assembly factor BamA